jgi:hypothetical protein
MPEVVKQRTKKCVILANKLGPSDLSRLQCGVIGRVDPTKLGRVLDARESSAASEKSPPKAWNGVPEGGEFGVGGGRKAKVVARWEGDDRIQGRGSTTCTGVA